MRTHVMFIMFSTKSVSISEITYSFLSLNLIFICCVSPITVECNGDVQLLMSIETDKTDQNHIRNQSLDLDRSNKSSFVHNVPQMDQPKSQSGFDGDDLIFSGEGSGCWEDEDECNNNGADSGSGDDLITPVYISSSKPITEMPAHFRTSTATHIDSQQKICDDEEEDCLDGSGSGETYSSTTSSNKVHIHDRYTTRSPRPTLTWTPPSLPPVSTLPTWTYPINEIDNDMVYHTQRPVSTSPSKSEAPTYEISGSTRNPTVRPPHAPHVPQTIPSIVVIPKMGETPKVATKEDESGPRVPKSSNDRTAMIIGVIAIGLIVVVIIAPIVLFVKVKYRTGGTYKVDETKNFQFAPVSGAPPMLASGMHQQTHLLNGASRTSPTDHHKPLLKMPKKKDLKEWYV